MVKLFCAIVDDVPGAAFSVRVDESDTVDDLKDAIKLKKPNKIKCDANELQLFLAKKDGAWLTENDVKGVSDTVGLKHLDAARAKLRRVGLSDEQMVEVDEDDEAAGNGHVNVLVVVPSEVEQSANKRAKTSTFIKEEDIKSSGHNLEIDTWHFGGISLDIRRVESDFPE